MSYSYLNNIRLKTNYNSQWDHTNYKDNLILDNIIRNCILKFAETYQPAYLCNTQIEIVNNKENTSNNLVISIHYVKNSKRLDIVKLVAQIKTLVIKTATIKKYTLANVDIKFKLINNPLSNAKYVCFLIAKEMTSRINYKRLQRISKLVLDSGSKGCILSIQGRINGHEIARKDYIIAGQIGRNTLSNNLKYSKHIFFGKSGCVGIKVWINNGKLKNNTGT